LSRSLHDLVVTLKAIADKGAKFRSLREPWANTDSPSGRFMIAILGGMAEFERELIRSRMADGISRKRARGEHLGPDFKLSPEAQKAIVRRTRTAQIAQYSFAESVDFGLDSTCCRFPSN
jgi:DNA invertase Pin-like site-specific DNA recombinase